MKTRSIIPIFAALLCATFVLADTEYLLPLQGQATDTAGVPVPYGDVSVRIYDANIFGNLVYDSGADFSDSVHNGIFDVLLGSVTPLRLDNTRKYYMEIDVNGQEIVGDNTTGRAAFWPGGGNHSHTHSAGEIIGGILSIDGLRVDSTTLYVDSTNHRVGIGTVSPGVTFDVLGTARFSALYRGAYAVWDSGNDGSSSGLDADYLDGQDSAYYRNADMVDGYHANSLVKSWSCEYKSESYSGDDVETIYCSIGYVATGGGCNCNSNGDIESSTFYSSTGWYCRCDSGSVASAYIICCKMNY